MSQQELEQTDQEVMDLVNSAASKDAKRYAEQLAEDLREPTPEEIAAEEAEKRCREEMEKEQERMKAFVRKQKRLKILGVAACVLIATLLVTALLVPDFVICVVNLGVLICGMVAAIIIDRYQRYY